MSDPLKRECHLCHRNQALFAVKGTSRGWECTDMASCIHQQIQSYNELASRNRDAILKQQS